MVIKFLLILEPDLKLVDIVSLSKGGGLAASQRRERGKCATKTCDSIENEDAELGGREPPQPQPRCQRKEPDGICDAVDDSLVPTRRCFAPIGGGAPPVGKKQSW